MSGEPEHAVLVALVVTIKSWTRFGGQGRQRGRSHRGGEFGFALLTLLLRGDAVDHRIVQALLTAVALSMLLGPLLVRNNVCIGGFMGIYLTTGNGVATGNIVDGNTIGIQQAPSGAAGGLVAHNACFDSTYLGIQADSDATFRCFNNILVSCVNGIGLAGSEDGNAFWLCTVGMNGSKRGF